MFWPISSACLNVLATLTSLFKCFGHFHRLFYMYAYLLVTLTSTVLPSSPVHILQYILWQPSPIFVHVFAILTNLLFVSATLTSLFIGFGQSHQSFICFSHPHQSFKIVLAIHTSLLLDATTLTRLLFVLVTL